MKKFFRISLISLATILLFSWNILPGLAVTINLNLPGENSLSSDNPNPVGIIGNFYQFALMIGGLLAFGVIVYAGIKYSMAAGNPTAQSDAKDRITQALLGLLLLAGGGIVLVTLRPGFILSGGELTIPGIKELEQVEVGPLETYSVNCESFSQARINEACRGGDPPGGFCYETRLYCYDEYELTSGGPVRRGSGGGGGDGGGNGDENNGGPVRSCAGKQNGTPCVFSAGVIGVCSSGRCMGN